MTFVTHVSQLSNSWLQYSELLPVSLKSEILVFPKREEYEGKVRENYEGDKGVGNWAFRTRIA